MNEPTIRRSHIAREINLTPKLIANFHSKVSTEPDEDGCLHWKACRFGEGYGCFSIEGDSFKANRVAYKIAFGELPLDKLVLHTCDKRSCCNPEHLFLGNNKENSEDMVSKGRQATGKRQGAYTKPECVLRGTNVGTSKLIEDQVLEIRAKYSAGNISQMKLADQYAVHQSIISDIVRRETWKHI